MTPPSRNSEPPRVLVTGHTGKIGAPAAGALEAAGFTVVGFDAADGDDVRDTAALDERLRGCRYVTHLAAIPNDEDGAAHEIIDTNVFGTWAVLHAAGRAGVERVVSFSSIQATGLYEDDAPPPDYLPLDEGHRSYARSAYSVSKLLGEDMCRGFTNATRIASVCIRPPFVVAPEEIHDLRRDFAGQDAPDWRQRAWCDVRDVAAAVVAALQAPLDGHDVVFVSADDVAGDTPTAELAQAAGAPWRGATDTFAALVDAGRARQRLGWHPRHVWPRD